MTLVVTGAAGFIGGALVTHLLRAGHSVIGIDRVPQPPQPGLVVLTADLLDRDELVDAALASADAVFHLAGRPGVRDDVPGVVAARRRDNVAATARVLSAVAATVPVVAASSSSVYGSAGRPSRETDPLRPRGGYARSKVRAEQLCADRLRRGGVVAVARPFTVVGEGQRPDMAVSRWLRAACEGAPLRVFGSLDRRRDLTDVGDVVRALMILAERRVCGPVNIGTGRSFSLRQIVTAVGDVCRRPVVAEVITAPAAETETTCADPRRLRELVGFVPVTDLHAVIGRQLNHHVLTTAGVTA